MASTLPEAPETPTSELDAQLLYDEGCVVCRSFASMLEKKLGSSGLKLKPLAIESVNGELRHSLKDFRYRAPDGQEFRGKPAIDALARDFPEVKDFFWILPDRARVPALRQAYGFAKFLRRLLRRDCNCN